MADTSFRQFACAAVSNQQERPPSVTLNSGTSPIFETEDPSCSWPADESPCGGSCCPGTFSPYADRADYFAAIDMGRAVRDMGLLYQLTGNSEYAERARELLYTWFISPDLSMSPDYGGPQAIELFITLPGAYYGASLLWDYPGWPRAERDELTLWVERFATGFASTDLPAIDGAWRLVLLASTGALTQNSALLDRTWNEWRQFLGNTMGTDGSLPGNLENATFILNALSQVAEIAHHQGIDLYHEAPAGRSLETAFDHHLPFAVAPETFGGEIGRHHNNWAVLELAYRHFGKTEYLAGLEAVGRPQREARTMGPLTLTHGLFPAP